MIVLASFGLTIPASTSLIACGVAELQQRLNLVDVIKQTNLGMFDFDPSDTAILEKTKDLNEGLKIEELEVKEIDYENKSARIITKSGSLVYLQGEIEVSYTIELRILKNIIGADTDLGIFGKTPTVKEAMKRLEEKFQQKLVLSEVSITEINKKDKTLILSVNKDSKKYSNDKGASVTLMYQRDLRLSDPFVKDEKDINEDFADIMEKTGDELREAKA
jgi:hypothetical protein